MTKKYRDPMKDTGLDPDYESPTEQFVKRGVASAELRKLTEAFGEYLVKRYLARKVKHPKMFSKGQIVRHYTGVACRVLNQEGPLVQVSYGDGDNALHHVNDVDRCDDKEI